jgi:hypothetical protein
MTDTGNFATITSDLEDRSMRLVNRCREEFLAAKFTGASITVGTKTYTPGLFNDGSEAIYRVPSSRDPNGSVKYGYYSPLPSPNDGFKDSLAAFVRFEPDLVLRESASATIPSLAASVLVSPFPSLPSPTLEILNYDVNGDQDLQDTFLRGKIILYVAAPNGSALLGFHPNPIGRAILSDYALLGLRAGTTDKLDADIDRLPLPAGYHATYANDPLLRFVDALWPDATTTLVTNSNVTAAGKAIVVTAFHGTWDFYKKRFFIRGASERVRFQNPQ